MDVEVVFWEQLDPLYHLKQATCFRYTKDVAEHYKIGSETLADTALGKDLSSGFADMQQSAMRFTRFHAIETLMTVLLGSGLHGPVPRFAAKFRNDKFNSALADVGKKVIPSELSIPGTEDFSAWLAAKFWGRHKQEPLTPEIEDFIALQALFYSQKSAYNAFKHGCRVGHSLPKFSVKDDRTGEWKELIKMESAVAWMDWSERGENTTVQYGVVECDAPDDHGSILVMAMLVRAMKAFRLLRADQQIEIQMPEDITLKKHLPQSWTMKAVIKRKSSAPSKKPA